MDHFGVCLLEDDEFADIFITQEVSKGKEYVESVNSEAMEVNHEEGCVQRVGKVGKMSAVYSNISDAEDDFVNPSYGRVNE